MDELKIENRNSMTASKRYLNWQMPERSLRMENSLTSFPYFNTSRQAEKNLALRNSMQPLTTSMAGWHSLESNNIIPGI